MTTLSRRALLGASTAVLATSALAGCAALESSVITLTQAALSDVQNVLAGLNTLQGALGVQVVSQTILAQIEGWIGDAQTVVTTIAAKVGGSVSTTTVQGLFNDLEAAAAAVAAFLGTNPYLAAVEALLPILAAAWAIVMPAKATAVAGMDPADARSRLSKLPRPTPIK